MLTTRRFVPSVLLCATLALLLSPASSGPQSARPSAGTVPGQSWTTLPDGRALILGGQGAQGPSRTASVYDPRTGTTTALTPLQPARAWHTATVLPDGTVLVLGGVGPNGQALAEAQRLDPATGTMESVSIPGLMARAQHSATLLTDGRVLIAGGADAAGRVLAQAELWTPQTGALQAISAPMAVGRSRHAATLLGDGTVLVWEGMDAGRAPVSGGELFDPVTATFRHVGAAPLLPNGVDPPQLEAALPSAGAIDVALDTLIALRFSKPVRVDSANEATVILSGPQGAEPVRVVPAEGGMLAFVTPESPLIAGARYTVALNGLADSSGHLVPFTRVEFTTVPVPTSGSATTPLMPGARSDYSTAHAHHAALTVKPGARAELDEFDWKGPLRDGKPYSRWQDLPPLKAPPGVTALSGQVLRLNGQPLADVTLQIGTRSAKTDQTGRFLLKEIDPGPQELVMDGSTANRPGRTYATFDYGVAIEDKTTKVLPFTIWMPLLDMRHATPVPAPTPQELVATSPRIPELEVRVPAGVILQTDNGPLPSIPLTQIPLDRPPFPLPPGTTFFFTPQGHGAKVLRADGTPNPTGVRIILPNVNQLPPGTRLPLTHYNYYQGGWTTYGHGIVSDDARQIVPEPGVEFKRLGCIVVFGQDLNFAAPILAGLVDGDPVDLGTGLLTQEKVDLVVPDVIPIVISRHLRPGNSWPLVFGVYFTHPYQLYLVGDATTYTYAQVVLPDGAKVRFNRISPGTDKVGAIMEHTATPTAFYKARMTWNAPRNGWDIKLVNGLVYQFNDAAHLGALLVGIRDRFGNQLTISRSMPGNTEPVTRVTSPNGYWVDFSYIVVNTIPLVSQVRDNLGRTVSYGYTDSSLRTVTDPAGGVTEYTWVNNRIASIKDPRNIVFLTNEYNAQSRVIKQTQADGTFYQFAYTLDGQGKVTQTDVTDPKGNVRRVTFNANGYALTDTQAYGTGIAQTTTYTRDATSNLVTSMTDALARQTTFTYNSQGQVLTITRLAGTGNAVTTTMTYEPTFSQVASIADPLSHTTSFGYDGVGNLTTITDPLSHQTTLTYNAQGQPLTIADALSNTTTMTYADGGLATITNPVGKTTTRFTDGGGRLTATTTALGQQTRYEYDALNQLTKITDPLGGQTQLAYDGNGNLLSVTDARSNTTSYAYNSMDRASTRTDPLTRQESYGYDNNGNPTAVTDRKSQVTGTTYDTLNRPTLVTYQDSSTTSYTWDAGNRLTQIVDSLSGTITRSYDGLDRLTQEVTPQGTVSYTYDAASRRTSMTVLGQPSANYTYDSADRLTQITQGSATVSFAYDNANRRTSLTLPNGVITEYAYDAASRLTGLTYKLGTTPLGALTYTYDANGNRTVVGGSWARTGLPAALASATYNAANHQLTFGGSTLSYDLNGNLTGDGTNTYTWDARNRLVSISGGTASFQYDAQGRRTSKSISGAQTAFLYDGVNPMQELNGSTVTANLLTGLGIDEYLTRTDTNGARHFLTDGLGSTIALSDATGELPTSYSYAPFGATSPSGSATGNAFDYTGREEDATGLKYYRARYYHSALQRFISEDPTDLDGGDVNLYGYAANDPVNLSDPSGLAFVPERGFIGEDCVDYLRGAPQLAGRKGRFLRWLWRAFQCDPSLQVSPAANIATSARTAAQAARVVKAVNLPAWKTVGIDTGHILARHTAGGGLSAGRTIFPGYMSERGIERAIREAYRYGQRVTTQGDRVLLRGQGQGLTIEMWLNRATNVIETAYPVF